MKFSKKNLGLIGAIFGYAVCILAIILLPGAISTALSVFYMVIMVVVGCYSVRKSRRLTGTFVLLLPIILSVTQNVYLGIGAWKLNASCLQVLISLHFLLFSSVVLLNMFHIMRRTSWAILAVVVLIIASTFLFVVYPAPFMSALSSVRNILSCMLLYCFGIVLSNGMNKEEFYRWIKYISWFVVVFGVIEWASGVQVWQVLNISRLWALKGIPVNLWGVPPNWYSSEYIMGGLVRRMVSSFADPVNLGTFLFSAFMVAWYRKEKKLCGALAICALFTVSKGALLGFLIFCVVYVWQTKKYRFVLPIICVMTLLAGLLFIRYSLTSSSGSIIAHAKGFISAFDVIVKHPFGLGIGNVGVLAGLFNESLLNASVSETGIGMIIAQLGIVGIGVYVFFFWKLGVVPNKWNTEQFCDLQRKKVLYYSLLFAFIANAAFNEVALSPNSCGLYFIEMAILNSTDSVYTIS